MGAKQRQDQGTGRGAREEYRVDKAPVLGMEGESRRTQGSRRILKIQAGEDDPEEDETPVIIPSSAVTMHPKGTQAPASSLEAQVLEERVDLSNDMTRRQKIKYS